VWLATAPPDEAGLTTLARALNPDERRRAERFRVPFASRRATRHVIH
jgi:hypothetical protein